MELELGVFLSYFLKKIIGFHIRFKQYFSLHISSERGRERILFFHIYIRICLGSFLNLFLNFFIIIFVKSDNLCIVLSSYCLSAKLIELL